MRNGPKIHISTPEIRVTLSRLPGGCCSGPGVDLTLASTAATGAGGAFDAAQFPLAAATADKTTEEFFLSPTSPLYRTPHWRPYLWSWVLFSSFVLAPPVSVTLPSLSPLRAWTGGEWPKYPDSARLPKNCRAVRPMTATYIKSLLGPLAKSEAAKRGGEGAGPAK